MKTISSGVPGSMPIDDFVVELEKDSEWAADLAEARTEIANSIQAVSKLAAIRLAKGLSQRQLADMVLTSQPAIAKLERGIGNPEVATLRRVAEALGCRIDEVLLAFEARRGQ